MKDVDFAYDQITIRDGKGPKDRVTMLPASLKADLREHLKMVKGLVTESLCHFRVRSNGSGDPSPGLLCGRGVKVLRIVVLSCSPLLGCCC